MINIIINYPERQLEIESTVYKFNGCLDTFMFEKFLQDLLNKVYYGGEKICLEIKNQEGFYKEIDRW